MTTTATTFLHLLGLYLASRTTDPQDRLCLARNMTHHPITGGPHHGWKV